MADGPTVWRDHAAGRTYYRASAMGRCTKALVLARLGYAPKPITRQATLDVFAEGHLHESSILDAVRKHGWHVEPAHDYGWGVSEGQSVVELEVAPGLIIRGHTDGRAHPPNQPRTARVLEAKSMSQAVFDRWLRHGFDSQPGYRLQIGAYAHAVQLPILYACKNRNNGQVDIQLFDDYPIALEVLRDRVLEVEDYAARGVLPDCDHNDFPCPYYHMHPPKEVTITENILVDNLCAEYDRHRQAEEAAKQRKYDVRDKIVLALGGATEIVTPTWKVTHGKHLRVSPNERETW